MPTDPEQAAERVREYADLIAESKTLSSHAADLRALLAERDRLAERLAANSGWAEDDEMARLREALRAMVEGKIRAIAKPDGRDSDRARYFYSGKMDAYADVLMTLEEMP